MFKNKLNFKLINMAVLVLIIYLLYATGHLWMGITNTILAIFSPFILAFGIAYALYPLLRFLQSKKIPKSLGIMTIISIFTSLIAMVVFLITPLLYDQLSSLFSSIISFINELSMKFDLDFDTLQATLNTTFNDIIKDVSIYISDGAITFISVSLGVITTILITFSATIYFLTDMEKIRKNFAKFLRKRNRNTFKFFKILDNEMKNYLDGFVKILFITLIEYTLAFYIIGHPDALLLGFLACIATLIPYFGGMMTNTIAVITAFVISPALFVRTIILFFVLSAIDGYLINPWVYGKTNAIHPIVVILSVFAGGILFGVVGVIISLPVAIILIATLKFYKETVIDMIEDYKEDIKEDELSK